MQIKGFAFKANDGTELWINRWAPDPEEEIKGIVQLHHGLAEHSLRYDRIGSILAENGYVFNAYDMRGHGKTAELAVEAKTGMFGKLADKDGFARVVEDLHEVIDSYKKEYPGKKIVLLGHSFGSFVAQGYIENYGKDIDGCVLCGTAGPRDALIFFGKIAVSLIKAIRGGNSFVPFLDTLAFGNYNEKTEKKTNHDWLSRNEMNVQMFFSDKWCNIPLTTSFYSDMMTGLSTIHNRSNIDNIPKELPLYMIYGGQDPVGDYGKTVQKLYKIYCRKGIKNIVIKEYLEDRHEILNEVDKEVVESDLLAWLNGCIG